MPETFSSLNSIQKPDEERVNRAYEKHDSFLELTLKMFQEYIAKNHKNFYTLSSADKNKITNDFLLQEYPESQSDFRTKLKLELLK